MSDYHDSIIQPTTPMVGVKDKPVLYLPDGREVVIKKPVGFAGHPAVPAGKAKGGAR